MDEFIDHENNKIDTEGLNLGVPMGYPHTAITQSNPPTTLTPNVTWEDIGGHEEPKKILMDLVLHPIINADLFKKMGGMLPSRGCLLYGPPGCGKTLLANAVAHECHLNFISVQGPDLLIPENVREIFDKARLASPCVLLFNELALALTWHGGNAGDAGGMGDRIVNQLLTEMDGILMSNQKFVFVIGTTHRPDLIDPTLMKPGRLDQLLYIPLPDYESRISIYNAVLRKSPVSKDVDIPYLAGKTEGFSGADITKICQHATQSAILEKGGESMDIDQGVDMVPKITQTHFVEAMKHVQRSVTDEDILKYEIFAKNRIYTHGTWSGEQPFVWPEPVPTSGDIYEDDDDLYAD